MPSSQAGLFWGLGAVALNRFDVDMLQEGYYERLTRVERFNSQLWEVYAASGHRQDEWQPATVPTGDFLGSQLRPSSVVFLAANRAPARINAWGMRDREYALTPALGTVRLAVLGPSFSVGSGVGDDETFDNVLEDRLNRQSAGPR